MKLVSITGVPETAARRSATKTMPKFPKALADKGFEEDQWRFAPTFDDMCADARQIWGDVSVTIYYASRGNGYWFNDGIDGNTGKKWAKSKLPDGVKKVTKEEAKEARHRELLEDFPQADKLVAKMNEKTGSSLTMDDYIAWYEGEGTAAQIKKFDKAVVKLVGQEAANDAENLARLDNLIWYAVGLGPDLIGGISMKALLAGPGKDEEEEEEKPSKPLASTNKLGNKALANKTVRAKDYNVKHDANGIPTATSLKNLSVAQLISYMTRHSKVSKAQLINMLTGK